MARSKRAGCDPQSLRGDTRAGLVECFHRGKEARASLTEHILLGHAAVLEDQLAGGGGANAKFVFLFAEAKAFGPFLHYKTRDPSGPRSGSVIAKTV